MTPHIIIYLDRPDRKKHVISVLFTSYAEAEAYVKNLAGDESTYIRVGDDWFSREDDALLYSLISLTWNNNAPLSPLKENPSKSDEVEFLARRRRKVSQNNSRKRLTIL